MCLEGILSQFENWAHEFWVIIFRISCKALPHEEKKTQSHCSSECWYIHVYSVLQNEIKMSLTHLQYWTIDQATLEVSWCHISESSIDGGCRHLEGYCTRVALVYGQKMAKGKTMQNTTYVVRIKMWTFIHLWMFQGWHPFINPFRCLVWIERTMGALCVAKACARKKKVSESWCSSFPPLLCWTYDPS